MHEPAFLLIYGSDASLIQTRRWVLERVGHRVHTALQPEQFAQMLETEPADLIILCHSLSPHDRDAALSKATQLRPELGRLILASDLAAIELRQQDELLSAFLNPQTLIGTVRNMVERSSQFATAAHR